MHCRKQTGPINEKLYSWKENKKNCLDALIEFGVCSVTGSAHIKTLPFLATHLAYSYFTAEFQTAFDSNMNDLRRTPNLNPLKSRRRFSGTGLEYTKRFLELSGHFTAMVGLCSLEWRYCYPTFFKLSFLRYKLSMKLIIYPIYF